ncbi:hypothetical protein DFQ27_000492 [Actinomortierella ambigua]|uniref:Uncharacterized protein n=1 Tax=Actinomortierella ambigua TaxID=1343610 RepID=A0A9P6TVY1_9FUNG|nr:hypothetical protein DFQ27_000492 [Actinomortierella ambigua]
MRAGVVKNILDGRSEDANTMGKFTLAMECVGVLKLQHVSLGEIEALLNENTFSPSTITLTEEALCHLLSSTGGRPDLVKPLLRQYDEAVKKTLVENKLPKKVPSLRQYIEYTKGHTGVLVRALFGTGRHANVKLMDDHLAGQTDKRSLILRPAFHTDGLTVTLLAHNLGMPKKKPDGDGDGDGGSKGDSKGDPKGKGLHGGSKGGGKAVAPAPQAESDGDGDNDGDGDSKGDSKGKGLHGDSKGKGKAVARAGNDGESDGDGDGDGSDDGQMEKAMAASKSSYM